MEKTIALICAFALLLGSAVPSLAADFTDVPAGAWYAEDVAWCREHGVMSGTDSITFSPNVSMSRAMLAAVLYRAAGSPAVTGQADFSDVPAGAYYNSAAKWADDHNYINGYGNRVFGSNDPVTRQDMVTILWRYAGSPAATAADFADESSISPYAAPAVDWARENDIVSGMGGNRFDPKGTASRAQVAAILHRFLSLPENMPEPSPAILLYQGQASLRVVTGEGKVIYIDPYAGDSYDLPADLILVTHGHYDHNAVEKVENRSPDCRIITHREAVINGEHQTFDLGFVTVQAVEAGYNDWHDVNQCAGYVLTFSDGRSIYVTGDTSATEQMPELAEKEIDYAFFCCDGVFNMGLEEAARCAEMVNARGAGNGKTTKGSV